MNWKKWKVGMVVAGITGALTGVIGLAAGITGRQACILIAVSTAKDILLFLKDHPAEQIEDKS